MNASVGARSRVSRNGRTSRTRRTLAAAVLAVAAIAMAAAPAGASVPSANQIEFNDTMPQFLATRAQAPAPYNWSTDGCSASIFSPLVNHYFLTQCYRHDFGYRNWRVITGYANTTTERKAIDDEFDTNMNARCNLYSHWNPERYTCYATAATAYEAVRAFGSLN